jgi:hypothetical protein
MKWRTTVRSNRVRMRKRTRGVLVLLMTIVLTGVGATISATPASASVDVPFDLIDVAGTVTFFGPHSYQIRTVVYNPYPQGSVGFHTDGDYFEGNGRYICVWGPTHTNSVYDSVRTWTDSGYCSIAGIDDVRILEYHNGSFVDIAYVDNPYR